MTDERAPLFGAALEQAEQQFRAAEGVPYVSRPLNLFYGLSQAGRAVAAARTPEGEQFTLAGHGIRQIREDPNNVNPSNFPGFRAKDQPRGAFVRLAEVLDSASLPEGGTMAELWRGLYEPVLHYPLIVDDSPCMIDVMTEHPPGSGFVYTANIKYEASELENLKAAYPDIALAAEVRPCRTMRHNDGSEILALNPGIPLRRYRNTPVLMPSIGGQAKTMHPLLVWWAILHSLSMLARYQPVEWTALLKIDQSPVANAIEYLLDVALDSVPEVLYDTLRGV